ncbi:MAG: amylo-alpha-1,6-glucosidase [Chloroflexi bacterium]|nr:amylo-alpha-1,6-glucosidase [Chloroflexota bacterium]
MEAIIEEMRQAAMEVLLHNAQGPFEGLPRAAGWGYPEPYTRDLMISSLGILVSNHSELISALRQTLAALARSQSPLGQISSLAHDPSDLGSSDTTPWFLISLSLYRKATGESDFLQDAAQKALNWQQYQSPEEDGLIPQLPTSDWRDEQWVLGYGLYVNTLVYTYLRLYGMEAQAAAMLELIQHVDIRTVRIEQRIHEGLSVPDKPYYALWSYKMYNNERFDLLGNSLAILAGIASPDRARNIIQWIESTCMDLRETGELGLNLPPCLIPFILPGDPDWYPRLERFNQPGEYHNGGIWPFVCGFYVAALAAAGEIGLAGEKLLELTHLIRTTRRSDLPYGFNEWHRAQDGSPRGQDWQTWSAAMYLYAAAAVEQGKPPLLDALSEGYRSRQVTQSSDPGKDENSNDPSK